MNKREHRIFCILITISIFAGCSDLGTEPEYRAYPADLQADWSPDGQWIVYRHQDYYSSEYDSTYPNGLYLIDSHGNNRRLLLRGEAALPAWSPDGQEMVFTRSGTQDTVGIWIIHLPDRREYRLGFGAMPDWSPDGEQIVFSGHPGTTRSESQI